jgi:hypothetical protein
MSYTLIEERTVKAARKAHQCIWCGELIPIGTSYVYERSVFEGDPQSNHWHSECVEAMRAIMAAEGECEMTFDPGQNERPTPQHCEQHADKA